MAVHGITDSVIGFAFDGTGYGTDGTVWGGEVLVADYEGFDRVAHLAPVSLPGGDTAVRQPARMALSHLRSAGIPWGEDLPPVRYYSEIERRAIETQIKRAINTVPTTSMGRLFDAASALAGVRQTATYEAQAAIEFEALVDPTEGRSYEFDLVDTEIPIILEPGPVLAAIVEDVSASVPTGLIAARFHTAVATMIVEVAERIRARTGITTVGLSGVVFQNVTLTHAAAVALGEKGFAVLTHRLVPPNDGGLALGQAVIAATRR
jgi:hydrogenase maturation protein HypF